MLVLYEMLSFFSALWKRDWAFAASLLFGTEWSEGHATYGGWTTWPHCCTQAGCWMHSTSKQWCGCKCVWCRLARKLGKENHRDVK